jgi:hypothetical protein
LAADDTAVKLQPAASSVFRFVYVKLKVFVVKLPDADGTLTAQATATTRAFTQRIFIKTTWFKRPRKTLGLPTDAHCNINL